MAFNKGWDRGRFMPYLAPGEGLCRTCPDVELELSGDGLQGWMKGSHKGNAHLTTQRFVVGVKTSSGNVQAVSMPFYCLQGIEVKQPIFGANYLQGNICAEPNEDWKGRAVFKMYFMSGGAIEFAMEFLHLIRLVPPNPPAYQHVVPTAVPVAQPAYAPAAAAAAAPATASAPPAEVGATGQAAYYQPGNPHTVYMPAQPSAPTASDEPPSYQEATTKKNQ